MSGCTTISLIMFLIQVINIALWWGSFDIKFSLILSMFSLGHTKTIGEICFLLSGCPILAATFLLSLGWWFPTIGHCPCPPGSLGIQEPPAWVLPESWIIWEVRKSQRWREVWGVEEGGGVCLSYRWSGWWHQRETHAGCGGDAAGCRRHPVWHCQPLVGGETSLRAPVCFTRVRCPGDRTLGIQELGKSLNHG